MPDFDRPFLLDRAEHRCEYCRLHEAIFALGLQTDHVIARQHGGGDGHENLAMACANCNLHKGTNIASIDPFTRQIIPLFNPRTQNWFEHFDIVGDRVRGLSPEGRATVNLLRMNDDDQLDLRYMFRRRSDFP